MDRTNIDAALTEVAELVVDAIVAADQKPPSTLKITAGRLQHRFASRRRDIAAGCERRLPFGRPATSIQSCSDPVLRTPFPAASAPPPAHVEFVLEINRRSSTRNGIALVGTESRGTVKDGARFKRGSVRLDVAIVFGVTPIDAAGGTTGGVTCLFRPFSCQSATRAS